VVTIDQIGEDLLSVLVTLPDWSAQGQGSGLKLISSFVP